MDKPNLPVPPPLRGKDTPFTRHTVQERMPGIVDRILAENDLPETAVTQLNSLLEEMKDGVIRPLPDHLSPDLDIWQTDIVPYAGQPWLDVPWFFAETYFYRRVIVAVDHFRSGIDP